MHGRQAPCIRPTDAGASCDLPPTTSRTDQRRQHARTQEHPKEGCRVTDATTVIEQAFWRYVLLTETFAQPNDSFAKKHSALSPETAMPRSSAASYASACASNSLMTPTHLRIPRPPAANQKSHAKSHAKSRIGRRISPNPDQFTPVDVALRHRGRRTARRIHTSVAFAAETFPPSDVTNATKRGPS